MRSRKTRKRGGSLCKTRKNARNIYTIDPTRKIGSSWYVYDDLENKDVVIKEIGPFYYAGDVEQAQLELQIAQLASDLQVGPLFIYGTLCPEVGRKYPIVYLVMERIYGDTVENLKATLSDIDYTRIMDEYKRLLDILYDHGITITDRAERNIMYGYTRSHPEPRVWIIDFGCVSVGPVAKNKRNYSLED